MFKRHESVIVCTSVTEFEYERSYGIRSLSLSLERTISELYFRPGRLHYDSRSFLMQNNSKLSITNRADRLGRLNATVLFIIALVFWVSLGNFSCF